MSFERLTDEGPEGRVATFAAGETPQPSGVAFVRSTNPKANCRLKRTTYETTALSGSPSVRWLFSNHNFRIMDHFLDFFLFQIAQMDLKNLQELHQVLIDLDRHYEPSDNL